MRWDLWYVVVIIDLAAVFCCRVRLNIDFQQLNGRNVGVIVAIVVVVLNKAGGGCAS